MVYLGLAIAFALGVAFGAKSTKSFFISFLTGAINQQLITDNTDEKDVLAELKKIDFINLTHYLFYGLHLSRGRN